MMEQKNKKNLNFGTATGFILRFMSDMKLQYVLFYLGWLFHTMVEVITPIIFGVMINQIVYYNNIHVFMQVGLVFLYVTVFGVVLYYLIYEMYGYLWNGINRRLRIGMFRQLQKLEAGELVKLNHGETVNMIHFWSLEAVHFMIRNIVHNLNNIIKILVCIIIIFAIHPWFGLVTVVLVPVNVLVSLRIGKRIRANSNRNRDAYGRYAGWLFEVIHGISDLKLLGAEPMIYRKMDEKQTEMNCLNQRIAEENAGAKELLTNVKNVILVIQYGLLGYLAIHAQLTIGTIIVLLTFFNLLSSALSATASNYMDAQQRISVIQKMYDFFGKATIRNEDTGKKRFEGQIESIRFDDCSFSYGEQPVLKGIDVTVNKGEKVAIVGSSGSGKSTMLNLLLGLYQPDSGQILINGQDLQEYEMEAFYQHISAVFQQVILLEGTVRQNLQMGKVIPEEHMAAACGAAGIWEEICAMEDKLDAKIVLGGSNLSGGQRQRIGIARAYLKESDVVIMDEATSALDAENEKNILAKWDDILHGRICIVVSHRLNTVLACNRVIMLRDGQIHRIGTPREMLETQEFRELFAIV